MGYERDEAMRVQEATEEMIRMRTPRERPYRHVDEIKRLRKINDGLLILLETLVEENHLSGLEIIARARAASVEAKGK